MIVGRVVALEVEGIKIAGQLYHDHINKLCQSWLPRAREVTEGFESMRRVNYDRNR